MYFKNAQVYRLAKGWSMSLEALAEQLGKKVFHPCGSQDMESRGRPTRRSRLSRR